MVRLVTLGACAAEVGKTRIAPDAEMVFAALLVLACEAGRRIPRQELIQLLWPAADDAKARHCLRQTLYKLKQLGVELDAADEGVCLPLSAVRADYLELESGDPALSSVGDFLPGYAPAHSLAFTARLERYRGAANGQLRRALLAALTAHRKAARWPEAESIARRCLQLDPLNEEATLALAEATALAGNKAQALAILDRYTAEVAGGDESVKELVRLQPAILRRRIAERIPERRYGAAAEADFVGREESVAYLNALLEEARAARGRGCLVWGDAGIGKTRLVTEFTDAAALRGARVQRVGCQPSDVHRPLSVFVDVVPSLLNVPGALGCSPESMSYLKRLTEHDRSSTTPSVASREAEFLYGRVRRALLDLVDAIAAEGTLVLLVEDVHWLDAMSWSVLREMVEWGASRRLLIVMTSRTPKSEDEASHWAGRPLARHHLAPLADRSTAAIVDSLLRSVEQHPAVDEALRARWAHLADGNPLFARELVQQWLATGTAESLPESLLSLVDARIGRLSAAALRVLQTVAILGKNATLERVDAVLEYRKHEMLEALEELDAAGVVVAAPPGLRVRHELLADAAMKRLSTASAQMLHRGAAMVLEAELDAPQSASLLWDCAGHWHSAGLASRALSLATRRATHLLELGLPLEAAAVCEQANEYCSDEQSREELLRTYCYALRTAGEWRRLLALLGKRKAHGGTCTNHGACDEWGLTELHARYRSGEDVSELLRRTSEYVQNATAAPTQQLEAACLAFTLAYQTASESAFLETFRHTQHLLSEATIDLRLRTRARLMSSILLGRFDEAVADARSLIALQRQNRDVHDLMRALSQSLSAFLGAGLAAEGSAALLEAHKIACQCASPSVITQSAAAVLQHYVVLENWEAASTWYERVSQLVRNSDSSFNSLSVPYDGARIALQQGDVEEAKRRLGRDLSAILSDSAAHRRIEGTAIWLRVEIAAGRVPSRETVRSYERDLRQVLWAEAKDYEVDTLRCALAELGLREEAEDVVEQYLSRQRRGRSRVSAALRSGLRFPRS